MFWRTLNLVFELAVVVAMPVFLFVQWRRSRRNRRAFLEKRDQLQRLYGSGEKKLG